MVALDLAKRYTCDDYGNCTYTDWDIWIRWVVLVVVIALFLLAFFLCSCANARRRRAQGLPPRYGTNWAARPFYHHGDPYNQGPPPPQYSAGMPEGHQPWNGAYAPGGGQGVELQQPSQSYAPGRSTMPAEGYAPPEGPPPNKAMMK